MEQSRSIESIREQLEQLAETIERASEKVKELCEYLDFQDREDRRFPPYREKLNPRGHVRPIFWHRIRSNPHRKRKPH